MTLAAGDIAFAGYRLCGQALRPLVPLILSYRAANGKEDQRRSAERYGEASAARPPGRVVWVHAASVGETNAVLPLIGRLTGSGCSVVFTSTTVTSAVIAERRLPSGAVHQFAPYDIAPFIRRFLAHWRPDLALFVESELWPNMIRRVSDADIPLVIVNGRLSARSHRGWQRFAPIARSLFSRIRLILAQSEKDGERYASLGAGDVVVTGNLKYDAPPLAADEAGLAELRGMIGDRPVWLAASTHDDEEVRIGEAHRRLAGEHPGLLTMIAPRHPNRGDAIRASLEELGLSVAQRSRGERPGDGDAVYLADTLGELGLLYRLAPIAFLGGSLIPHGGQNPIEPARIGVAVLHGPHVHNFAEVYGAFDEAVTWAKTGDVDELVATVARLLSSPDEIAAYRSHANGVLDRHAGALEATVGALKKFTS